MRLFCSFFTKSNQQLVQSKQLGFIRYDKYTGLFPSINGNSEILFTIVTIEIPFLTLNTIETGFMYSIELQCNRTNESISYIL